MRSLLPCLFACLLLAGCSKTATEEVTPEPAVMPEKVCYPQHVQVDVTYPSGYSRSWEENYTYAVKGRLFSQIAYSERNVDYGSTFVYDAKGRISREDFFGQYSVPIGYYTFEYDAQDRVSGFRFYEYNKKEQQFALASRHVCEYANGKLLKTMYNYYTLENGKEEHTTTAYTYTNGQTTKATWYNDKKQKTTEYTLTYDDKKNFIPALPAYQAVMLISGFPHKHNILSLVRTDAEGKVMNNLSYTRTATYTEKSYLQSTTTTYLDGRVQKDTYTYDCE